MITFACHTDMPAIRRLWKDIFQDTDSFLDDYFSSVFKTENTLVCVENGNVVAALQFLPYKVCIHGKVLSSAYLYAVMTAPEYRKKGYLNRLMEATFCLARDRDIPLIFLIPQEAYLFDVYRKYGFAEALQVEKYTELLHIEAVPAIFSPTVTEAWEFYHAYYKNRDAVILSENQFQFVYRDVLRAEGRIFSTTSADKITGLCFTLPKQDGVHVIEILAENEEIYNDLLQATGSYFQASQLIVQRLPQATSNNKKPLGMIKIINEQAVNIFDVRGVYPGLLMNE